MDTKTNGLVKKIHEELLQTKQELTGKAEQLLILINKLAEGQEAINEELAILQRSMENKPRNPALTEFLITPEEKTKIKLPQGNIGISEFARCVNAVIDQDKSKKLTGVELNKQLKKMGILSEKEVEEGKKRTVINEKSKDYGIETETRTFSGTEYEKIVFNKEGKSFLIENLERIMAYKA